MKMKFGAMLGCGTALAAIATQASAQQPTAAQPTTAPALPASADQQQAPVEARSSDAQTQSQDTQGLGDIIVTAQRVESSLQRTPVAVTALGTEALRERAVTNISDLNALAPNISIGTRSGTGGGSGAVTIRGIGVDANPPASPAVGIYVDEVYQPGSYGNLIGLFDVARVEILRGPQGTLFGRNTISGAIQYVSIKPELNRVSGYGEVSLGSFDRRDFSGALNLPLGNIAALRVSGAATYRDGFVRDQLQAINRGSQTNHQVRAQLRVEPSSDITIDLKGEYLRQKSNGRATVNTGFNYNAVFGRPFAPNGLDPFIAPNSYTNPGFNDPDYFRSTLKIGQGTIAWKISDQFTLKSISAYSDTKSQLVVDQDGTPLSIISVNRGTVRDRLFTQELQLSGRVLDDRLQFTLGGYYYNDKQTSAGATNSVFGGPPSDPFGDYKILTRSFAFYGQATFNITDKLAIVGGLRYTDEKIAAKDVLNPTSGSSGFKDTSPLIGINFQATRDFLFYAKRSRGFRAGGFSPNSVGYFPFGPENAVTYEAGARMQFLGGRVRVNPTIFTTDWKNIQFNDIAIVPGIPFPFPIISNAGNARLRGAELEAQARITPRLTINGSLSFLDAQYRQIAASQAGKITLNSDLKRAPKSQFSVGGRYQAPLGDLGSLTFNVNYAHQARQRSQTADTDFVAIRAYGLLNARIEFLPKGGIFSLAVFATNLTDEAYPAGGTNYGAGGTIPGVSVDSGRPREFGVTGRVNF